MAPSWDPAAGSSVPPHNYRLPCPLGIGTGGTRRGPAEAHSERERKRARGRDRGRERGSSARRACKKGFSIHDQVRSPAAEEEERVWDGGGVSVFGLPGESRGYWQEMIMRVCVGKAAPGEG